MAAIHEFLEDLKRQESASGNFVGLLHILVGRRVQKPDGMVISTGVTWREAAVLLKKVRWDKDAVRELGMDPATLPPRDRLRYWYTAIAQARLDSSTAAQAGDRLAQALAKVGYVVSTAPQPKQDAPPS
jgi:hypothetical protein